jgi:hypothetical protein
LAEDLISHVLARRKHLAIDTLTEALDKIGYRLEIRPTPQDVGPAKDAVNRRSRTGARTQKRRAMRSKAV